MPVNYETEAAQDIALLEAKDADSIADNNIPVRDGYFKSLFWRYGYLFFKNFVGDITPPSVNPPQVALINVINTTAVPFAAGSYYSLAIKALTGTINVTIDGVVQTVIADTDRSSMDISDPAGRSIDTAVTVQAVGSGTAFITRKYNP